jgi:hypothetical protein
MISHLDLSKSAAESDPPRSIGAARARSTSIFVFLDFVRGALGSAVFCRRGFIDEATHKRDRRVDETPVQDFQPPRRESAIDAWELKASVVSAM